ncbi:MAG: hypothetical protein KI792_05990 [Alphaproteobacteria bacterium]|nr:hypothetical protein [Alphaproteobacteria bacterium SS10]
MLRWLADKLTRGWHVLIILACAFGIAMFFRLGKGFYELASNPDGDQSPWLWWLLFGGAVVFAVGLFVEAARRVRIIMAPRDAG